MGIRKSAEERAEAAATREQRQVEAEERKRLEQIEKARQAFFRTPAGQARTAYDRGDHVLQCSFDVMNQKAIIIPMVGGTTSQTTSDPTAIINSVCHEGWELVTGSFVFVEQGQESRDKFLASGQNVAIKGTTVGYYLFRRCDGNRRQVSNPWDETSQPVQRVTEDERRRLIQAAETGQLVS